MKGIDVLHLLILMKCLHKTYNPFTFILYDHVLRVPCKISELVILLHNYKIMSTFYLVFAFKNEIEVGFKNEEGVSGEYRLRTLRWRISREFT